MKNNKQKYNITVKLVGKDGNAFNLIGIVLGDLKKAKIDKEEVKAVQKDLLSSQSYDELLQKIMSYVNVI